MFYGYGHSIYIYTIEMCSTFQPTTAALDFIVAENWDGAFYLMQQAEALRNASTPITLPPTIDDYPTDMDGSYSVSWTQTNPAASPDAYRLDELTGLTRNTDDAEAGSGLWVLDDFSVATDRYHSASHSFKSLNTDDIAANMVSAYPLPVEAGDTLSFWTWYNIETNWDYAFIEVSADDGRSYDILDTLTGSSGSWIQKQYPLTDYIGQTVYFRIRYCTDSYVLEDGIWIDDIEPVASWDTITTLSDTITNTYYDVTGRAPGDYWYQVKGHNTARGWGDFSHLSKTTVEELTCCPCVGDLDPGPPSCNNVVDLTDFTAFAAAYGSSVGDGDYNPCADIEPPGGDGAVDLTDFTAFASQYGQPCP
jgi:hypothetical protein